MNQSELLQLLFLQTCVGRLAFQRDLASITEVFQFIFKFIDGRLRNQVL